MLKIFYLKVSEWISLPESSFRAYVGQQTWQEVQQFRNHAVRRTRLLGEMLVREGIRKWYGWKQEEYEYLHEPRKKPVIRGKLPVYFNISHSGDWIVAAFSGREVGVDIEYKGQAPLEVARRYFHPAELECLCKSSRQLQEDLFYTYWTAKESFAKYSGKGLNAGLVNVEVRLKEKGKAELWEKGKKLPLYLSACGIDSGYACTVCAENAEEPELEKWAGDFI